MLHFGIFVQEIVSCVDVFLIMEKSFLSFHPLIVRAS